MNLLHRVSCFYSPKARRIASSSSNVMLGGRFLFFFLGFSKAFLIPYLAPLLTALDTRALPAIKIRGMIPPRWWVRRRVVVRLRLRRGAIPRRHWPHMVLGTVEGRTPVFISFLFTSVDPVHGLGHGPGHGLGGVVQGVDLGWRFVWRCDVLTVALPLHTRWSPYWYA